MATHSSTLAWRIKMHIACITVSHGQTLDFISLLLFFSSCVFNLIRSVQSLSCVQLFATPWAAAHQASLSLTISRSLPKFMSIESVYYNLHIIAFLLWSLQRTSCVCRSYLPDSTWQVPSSFLPVSLWAMVQ